MSVKKQRPTDDQITEEILALINVKQLVKPRTAFGDDNHAAIDAQREVLAERLSMDAIYDRFGSDEEDEDAFDDIFDQHALDAALEARAWMSGEREVDAGRPSKGWGVPV